MKRAIIRNFRIIRHRICRTIYYLDSCPIDCRKNYKAMAITAVQGSAFFAIGFVFLIWMFLAC